MYVIFLEWEKSNVDIDISFKRINQIIDMSLRIVPDTYKLLNKLHYLSHSKNHVLFILTHINNNTLNLFDILWSQCALVRILIDKYNK